jgi:hypothetical protein
MNRRLVSCLAITLTTVACGSTNAAVATPTTRILNGTGFSALYPQSWSVKTQSMRGATQYQLSSRGLLSNAGVPKPGAIGITIQAVPFSVIEASRSLNPSTWTPTQLVNDTIGTPPGATAISVATPAHRVSFAGYSAYGLTLTYTSSGTSNVQEDLVAIHGTSVYLVELDAEPSLQASGEAAMKTVTTTWGWATG